MQPAARAQFEGALRCPFGRAAAVLASVLALGIGCAQAPDSQPLHLQPVTPSLEARPRETLNLALQLENTADAPWRGAPELALPEGWRAVLAPTEVTLEPSERYLALFTVLVSAGAQAGEYVLPVTFDGLAAAEFGASYTVKVREVEGSRRPCSRRHPTWLRRPIQHASACATLATALST